MTFAFQIGRDSLVVLGARFEPVRFVARKRPIRRFAVNIAPFAALQYPRILVIVRAAFAGRPAPPKR
jgi:hypothetical protein